MKKEEINKATVKRLGLILSAQSLIEGMKSENEHRKVLRIKPKYTSNYFFNCSDEISKFSKMSDKEILDYE